MCVCLHANNHTDLADPRHLRKIYLRIWISYRYPACTSMYECWSVATCWGQTYQSLEIFLKWRRNYSKWKPKYEKWFLRSLFSGGCILQKWIPLWYLTRHTNVLSCTRLELSLYLVRWFKTAKSASDKSHFHKLNTWDCETLWNAGLSDASLPFHSTTPCLIIIMTYSANICFKLILRPPSLVRLFSGWIYKQGL